MILVLIDHDQGKMNPVSLEMLALAHRLAADSNDSPAAVLIGAEARPLVDELAAYGVAEVHLVQHERLDDYAPEAWGQCVVQLIDALAPAAVLAPGTERGNEVLAHAAALADLPLAANCVEVCPGDAYEVTRVRWGGSLLEEALLHESPKLLTVAPHMVPAEAARLPEGETAVEIFEPLLDDAAFRVRITQRVEPSGDKVSLSEARIVVGGGRGVGSAEGFARLEEFAELLGGVVGGSRVVTNLGWRPHTDQIGQTGTRIAPDLYIACGISGAIQHMVGCKGARQILAINTDRTAPIMSKADYAVIGDLHEVLGALIDEVKKVKGTR